jgi:hypothetical protein
MSFSRLAGVRFFPPAVMMMSLLVVPLEDVRPLDQQLPVFGGPDLAARNRPAHEAEAVVLDRRVSGHRARLGHAEALEHGHAAAVEELDDLRRDRRGT